MGATEAAGTAADCKPLRLLHWNILDGGGLRLRGIGDVVRKGRYDLVSLNELNGMSEARLDELGHEWGFDHAKLLQKSSYHLGLLSKHPLRLRAKDAGREFVHGLLCVDVLNMTLCVTHLNPHDVGRRLGEARAIVRRVPPDRPFLLAGDLNTLSSLDRATHESAGLARATIQLVIAAGRPSLGTAPLRPGAPQKVWAASTFLPSLSSMEAGHCRQSPSSHQVIVDGPHAKALSKKFMDARRERLEYSPMQALLDAPLHDLGVTGGHTVPTRINADRMHFAQLRLDYLFVNERLLAACGGQGLRLRAVVLRDDECNVLSDHFPIMLSFALPRAAGEARTAT
ncbi:MAG: endonuclease/exonuclease/phosphatase family protein [Gammaproteobacteria bacterium]